ncbi:hypothetical protein PISMIDRAFT_686760, partial [Pisolithus microcarpus 441]
MLKCCASWNNILLEWHIEQAMLRGTVPEDILFSPSNGGCAGDPKFTYTVSGALHNSRPPTPYDRSMCFDVSCRV